MQYYDCAEFKLLDLRIQRVRRLIPEKLSKKHGESRYADLERDTSASGGMLVLTYQRPPTASLRR